MKQSMLTTDDNPFDPFDQFDQWLSYDHSLGYNTTGYLARICMTSAALSDQDQLLAIEEAINEIVELNVNGHYIKVTREFPDPEEE